MAWDIQYHDDSEVVELTFSGKTSGQELKKAAASRIQFAKENGARKNLINALAMLAPKSTILDVLDIPVKVYSENRMDRTSSIAVVRPTDEDSHWITDFYENASIMRGWEVRLFSNRDDAMDWLQSSKE